MVWLGTRQYRGTGDSAKGSGGIRWFYRYIPLVVVVLAGTALSVELFATVRRWEREQMETEFLRAAEERVSMLKEYYVNNTAALDWIVDFFEGSEKVEREEFQVFVRDHIRRWPGVQALAWVPRVLHSERAAHEQATRAEGLGDYEIKERDARGNWIRARDRAEYFPMHYVEPFVANEVVVGFDQGSDPIREKSLRLSGDSGKYAATCRLRLAQAMDKPGFVVYRPIYRKGSSASTPAERREDLEGFAVGVYRIDDILEHAFAPLEERGVDVYLYDLSATGEEQYLGMLGSLTRSEPAPHIHSEDVEDLTGLHYKARIGVGDREGLVLCTPAPALLAKGRRWHSGALLVAGLGSTGLVSAYILLVLSHTARMRRFAAELVSSKGELVKEIGVRKGAEERMRIFRQFVETSGQGLGMAELDLSISYVNPTLCRIMSRDDPASIVGGSILQYYPGEYRDQVENEVIPAVLRDGQWIGELNLITQDGRIIPTLQNFFLIRDEAGEPLYFADVITDISEQKAAGENQSRLLEQVESVNRELRDFAYIVSHDLKAPLRGIKTLAEWIVSDFSDKLGGQGREQLDLLSSRVLRMHNLIDGVLQYSRLEQAKSQPTEVDLNEVVSNAIDLLAAPEHIHISIEGTLPTVTCDGTRVLQVFSNLLSNAVNSIDKAEGRIVVAYVEEDEALRFSISDNGCGIEKRNFKRIFQIFQTISTEGEPESTGVGLAVVKKIVETCGGKIWVESEPGQGSTFIFTVSKDYLGRKAVYSRTGTEV